jgi:hypothetical protein
MHYLIFFIDLMVYFSKKTVERKTEKPPPVAETEAAAGRNTLENRAQAKRIISAGLSACG